VIPFSWELSLAAFPPPEACGVRDAREPEFRLNIFEHAIEGYLSAINAAGLRVIEHPLIG